MGKLIDLTGQRFGRLIAIERVEKPKNIKKGTFWRCKCDCGNETITMSTSLREGRTKSCGCLWLNSISLSKGEAACNTAFRNMLNHAKERGITVEINITIFKSIAQKKCHYCGCDPNQKSFGKNGYYIYNGLDRIDSSIGYTIENCVPCCGRCNEAKSNLEYSCFLKKIKMIYQNFLQ